MKKNAQLRASGCGCVPELRKPVRWRARSGSMERGMADGARVREPWT